MGRLSWIRSLMLVSALALLAGCGGSDEESAGAATTGSSDEVPGLTLGIPQPLADYAIYLVAAEGGFFEKHNVEVELAQNLGANALNSVVSGQSDLMPMGGGSAVQAVNKGQDVSVVWANHRLPGFPFVTAPDITSFDQLRSVDNCRIATSSPGATSYFMATVYLEKEGLSNCKLVTAPSPELQTQGVLAGTYQGTVLGISSGVVLEQEGANLLIDPRDPQQRAAYAEEDHTTQVVWGITENLEDKQESMVRFLAAVQDAMNYVTNHSDAEVARTIKGVRMFDATPIETLEKQVGLVRPDIGPAANPERPGYLSEAMWETSLSQYARSGMEGIDVDDPGAQYDEIVDMSFYDEAAPRIFVVGEGGSTLSDIAESELDDAGKWEEMYEANRFWVDSLDAKGDERGTVQLEPGTLVRLP